jgi:beta-glucosidase
VLFRDASGNINKDFTGKLTFSWPKSGCQTPVNFGDADYSPLFALDYGLTYAGTVTVPQLTETGAGG